MSSRLASAAAPSAAWSLIGLATGIGATSALWLVLLGYRVDAEGSAASTVELVAGWGGLVVAPLGWLVATALLVRQTVQPLRR